MNKFLKWFTPLLSLALFSACVTTTMHQTGRTTGQTHEIRQISGEVGRIQTIGEDENEDILASLNGHFATGIHEKVDVTVGLNSSTTFTPGIKYQFLGNQKSFIASSVYGNIGINLAQAAFMSLINNDSSTAISLDIGLVNSIYLNQNFNINFGLRHCSIVPGDSYENKNNAVFSLGVMFGDKNKFSLEATKLVPYSNFKNTDFFHRPFIGFAYIKQVDSIFK